MFKKLIDNFLTKSYHKDILELMTSSDFDWYYNNNIASGSLVSSTNLNEYGFAHTFWHKMTGQRNTPHSHFIKPLLYQIMDVANRDFILRARADMVTWSKEDYIHQSHVDFEVSNIAAVFYVNETDGDTVFYNIKPEDVPKNKDYKNLKEYDRVSPKANRLVLFDGNLLHAGCSPTNHKTKILINSNFIKSENAEEYQKYMEERMNNYGQKTIQHWMHNV